MDKLLGALVTEIETEIYQVAGPAVQVYSQDIIVARINDAMVTFFEDKDIEWKRFIQFNTYTLDGVTGEVTGNVSTTYREYNHIIKVYPSQSDRPLTKWNYQRNPALIFNNQALFVLPSNTATKIFKVLPATATGDVVVIGKSLGPNWPYDDLELDTVEFDYLAIKYYVAWQMLVDDAANVGGADAMLQKFKNRYDELEQGQSKEPIAYNGGSGQLPTRWFDSDN